MANCFIKEGVQDPQALGCLHRYAIDQEVRVKRTLDMLDIGGLNECLPSYKAQNEMSLRIAQMLMAFTTNTFHSEKLPTGWEDSLELLYLAALSKSLKRPMGSIVAEYITSALKVVTELENFLGSSKGEAFVIKELKLYKRQVKHLVKHL